MRLVSSEVKISLNITVLLLSFSGNARPRAVDYARLYFNVASSTSFLCGHQLSKCSLSKFVDYTVILGSGSWSHVPLQSNTIYQIHELENVSIHTPTVETKAMISRRGEVPSEGRCTALCFGMTLHDMLSPTFLLLKAGWLCVFKLYPQVQRLGL